METKWGRFWTEADQRGVQIGFWVLIVVPVVFSLLPVWI